MASRDKILKEGLVRYRLSSMGLQKWRPRHLVFKVTHAGRLQLILHKESPATASNEIKEIAIDEFGGLEHNLKLDNEKYVFAIITTNITECFSTESPQDLTDWRQLLQEYLGKELVISINIPQKQNLLKAGKASLRIRNTGFTITTCESPPRCQGTWHIIHIRKYGGTEMFRFQTGSKCPTGEHLYSIEAKNNFAIKNLFNDLSNHRPIFADDRLGRRMTLERNFDRTTPNATHTPSRAGNNRLSLQAADRSSGKPLYENREQFQTMQASHHHHSSDQSTAYPTSSAVPQPTYGNTMRRASFDDGVVDPQKVEGSSRQLVTGSKISNQEDDKLYQNIHPSTPQRSSPTKKSHFSPVSVPVPEGYYNLTPPPLVRRHNSSPSSSPEEGSLHLAAAMSHGQELSIVGDSLIMNRSAHSKTPSNGDIGGTYQNVEFMRTDNQGMTKRNEIANDEIAPIIPATITEEPWSPRNYTNVAFARATAQGQSTSPHTPLKNGRAKKNRMTSLQKTKSSGYGQSKPERKVSMPPLGGSRNSPVQPTPTQTLVISTSSDDLLSPSPSSIQSTPVLRNSHSNMELNFSAKDKSLDYYNYCAPSLPAHSKALSLRNKLTLSSGHRVLQSTDALHTHKSAEILSPDSPDVGALHYSKLSRKRVTTDSASDSDIVSPTYASVDDIKVTSADGDDKKMKIRSASCDCLDTPELATQQAPQISARPGSHGAMYDKLGPLRDAINRGTSVYDSLGPSNKDEYLSGSSSSPDPCDDPSLDHADQRTSYLRRMHKYEYIGVELENRGSERSDSGSPVGMEHPSDWTMSLPVGFCRQREPAVRPRSTVIKATKTLPRRKQLPLQEFGEEQNSSGSEYSTMNPARPPRLSREEAVNPKPSVNHSQARSSVESVDSSESTKRESVFSNGSASSAELDVRASNSTLEHVTREHSNSPSHRVTHEEVAIRIRNTRSESPQEHAGNAQPQSRGDGPPPVPKKGIPEKQGSPPLPPRLQEQSRFTVPLPQAQFDFNKPPPPPKPKMLWPSPDLSYAAVTFTNGETPIYSHVDPVIKSNRPSMKIAQTHVDVSYVAVDFEMTAGLQRTSEQVADEQREFFETKQQS